MPWFTPDIKTVRILVRDQVRGNLKGADAAVPNSILRVLAEVAAGLCSSVLGYIDWLAKQLLPDTAEAEWLDRHGHMWLTNADGTTGRKLATLALGEVTLTGDTWVPVPTGLRLVSDQRVEYETTGEVFLAAGGAPTPTPIRALDPGAVGNRAPGAELRLMRQTTGINGVATVTSLDGGVDDESTDDLRVRVLKRIREPPMGGANIDYELWALAVAGVTRAWASSLEMGLGTVTVRFMMDELRASEQGFPRQSDIDRVSDYIDSVRPVATKDLFVVAPIRQAVHVQINRLQPDTPSVRAAIATSLQEMLRERAEPGGTIYAAWKNFAIMSAPGVASFFLANSLDDVMPSPGHMPVLGNIIYGQ